MKSGTILKASLVAVFVFTIAGAAMKVNRVEGADAVMITGIVAQLVFIATAIYEVATSHRLKKSEKWMWSIAFVLMGGVTGIVYLLFGRKNVVTPS